MPVFTDVEPGTFDVLDTGKKRNAADVLAIGGEKATTLPAAMVRNVWQYRNRPDQSYSGSAASVTKHQIVQALEANSALRDYTAVADRITAETGMIKSAAGGAAVLVDAANPRKKARPAQRHEGVIDGAGLAKDDPQLVFCKTMFAMARKQAGVVLVDGSLPLPAETGAADRVLSAFVFDLLDDEYAQAVLDDLRRILKPGVASAWPASPMQTGSASEQCRGPGHACGTSHRSWWKAAAPSA